MHLYTQAFADGNNNLEEKATKPHPWIAKLLYANMTTHLLSTLARTKVGQVS